jgi:hypothetical protein
MKNDLFKVRCSICMELIDLKENRYILLFEDRQNDNRHIFHKRITKAHFHLKCFDQVKIL